MIIDIRVCYVLPAKEFGLEVKKLKTYWVETVAFLVGK